MNSLVLEAQVFEMRIVTRGFLSDRKTVDTMENSLMELNI